MNFFALFLRILERLNTDFFFQGREYDELGNMRDWWNNNTLEQFESRI